MTRMTKSITLVLIGSTLAAGGYFTWLALNPPPREDETEQQQRAAGVHRTGGSARGFYHPWYFRSGSSWVPGGSAVRTGPSPGRASTSSSVHSGGFGGTGHAVSGGS